MKNGAIAVLLVVTILAGVGVGFFAGSSNPHTTTMTYTATAMTSLVTETSTVTDTETFSTTIAYVQQVPAIVTLTVACTGCTSGSSQYLYTGFVTNGTQRGLQTTRINGSIATSYYFVGSPSELATQNWSVSWTVYTTGITGTLEVKAYLNSALVSDKTTAASSGGLVGSITINAY